MSVHYLVKLKVLIAHVPPLSCYRKKLQNLSNPKLWPPNLPDLNPVDNSVWEMLQEKVYKTYITDLELSMTPLTNGCRNSDVIELGTLHSQWPFQFIQISDVCFVHLLLQQYPHDVINWIQIWQIWGSQWRWDKFRSFFLQQLNGSTCAMIISSFTR